MNLNQNTLIIEDNFVPFEIPLQDINDNFLVESNNDSTTTTATAKTLFAEPSISFRKKISSKMKRVSFHETTIDTSSNNKNIETGNENFVSSTLPKEAKIRNSWHGGSTSDDIDYKFDYSNVWKFFSSYDDQNNYWSNKNNNSNEICSNVSSEIGQEALHDPNKKTDTSLKEEVTDIISNKIQIIFESISNNINNKNIIKTDQIVSNMDKMFEHIKTKIEPFAEGEIPQLEQQLEEGITQINNLSYDDDDLNNINYNEINNITYTDDFVVGIASTPNKLTNNKKQKQQQKIAKILPTTNSIWTTQPKINSKILLVNKFLKSIPPIVKKTNKKRTNNKQQQLLKEEINKFIMLNITKQIKENIIKEYENELKNVYSQRTINEDDEENDMFTIIINDDKILEKVKKIIDLVQNDYIVKMYKLLDENGEDVIFILSKKRITLFNINTKKYIYLSLDSLDSIMVSSNERKVIFRNKIDKISLSVIGCLDLDIVSLLISNIEIVRIRQRFKLLNVYPEPIIEKNKFLNSIFDQTAYLNKSDQILLCSWVWIELITDCVDMVSDINRSGNLMYKLHESSSWTPGYVTLKEGILTIKEEASTQKNIMVIPCQSYTQVSDSTRPYTFKIYFNPYSFILFAAPDESQLLKWLQDIMISRYPIKTADIAYTKENVEGNYVLVTETHIVCYTCYDKINIVIPLQQVSAFKISKRDSFCVMELNCLEASENEMLNDVAFHFLTIKNLEHFYSTLLKLRYFKISEELLINEQNLIATNNRIKMEWKNCSSTFMFQN